MQSAVVNARRLQSSKFLNRDADSYGCWISDQLSPVAALGVMFDASTCLSCLVLL